MLCWPCLYGAVRDYITERQLRQMWRCMGTVLGDKERGRPDDVRLPNINTKKWEPENRQAKEATCKVAMMARASIPQQGSVPVGQAPHGIQLGPDVAAGSASQGAEGILEPRETLADVKRIRAHI